MVNGELKTAKIDGYLLYGHLNSTVNTIKPPSPDGVRTYTDNRPDLHMLLLLQHSRHFVQRIHRVPIAGCCSQFEVLFKKCI